ncbi:MAG: murein hydrolase activator EnvC family protein [Wenzhouxiangella sp.]
MDRPDRRILSLLAALSTFPAALAGAQDSAQLERELAALRGQIEQLQRRLDADLAQREPGQQALAEAERALAEAEQEQRAVRQRLEQTNARISALASRIKATEAAFEQTTRRLSAQLELVYRQGMPSRLKVLLNQQDPRLLRRQLAYHGHLAAERVALSSELQALQQTLATDRAQLEQERLGLAELEATLAAAATRLAQERAARDRALVELDTRIQADSERIAQLRRDADELAGLIEELARALEDVPMDVEVPSILDLAGTLPPPLEGRRIHDFGDRRSGEVRWTGWLLAAPAGAEVRAIAHGRVAYADWLRGYGMLIILDHGEGVISLYGHNETLLRGVGSWVSPGDVIAAVGRSGGSDADALYFEIRRDGQPTDPAAWLADS